MTASNAKRILALALERCPAVKPTTLEQFLGGLLDETPEDLAKLPGTPATVLSAQFVCYAKSSASLAEVLRRQSGASQQLTDAAWRIKSVEEKKAKKSTKVLEVTIDSDSPADKRCHACTACA